MNRLNKSINWSIILTQFRRIKESTYWSKRQWKSKWCTFQFCQISACPGPAASSSGCPTQPRSGWPTCWWLFFCQPRIRVKNKLSNRSKCPAFRQDFGSGFGVFAWIRIRILSKSYFLAEILKLWLKTKNWKGNNFLLKIIIKEMGIFPDRGVLIRDPDPDIRFFSWNRIRSWKNQGSGSGLSKGVGCEVIFRIRIRSITDRIRDPALRKKYRPTDGQTGS